MQRNITKKYLRQIRRLYKGKHKTKKNFLDELEQDLYYIIKKLIQMQITMIC